MNNGITVYWSKPDKALIVLDPANANLTGNLCGLCGNRNVVKYDDLMTETGELVSNLNVHGLNIDIMHSLGGGGGCGLWEGESGPWYL